MLNVGKLSELILKRSVLNKFRNKREEVLSGAKAGADAAVMLVKGQLVTAVSCSSVEYETLLDAKITMTRAVNSVAAEGGSPFAVLVSMIVPPETEESRIKSIMEVLEETASSLNVQIAGGHSEVSDKVNMPVFSVTAYGNCAGELLDSRREKDTLYGQDIVMTGYMALEATGVAAVQHREELSFAPGYLAGAADYLQELSVVKHAQIALEHGSAVMHDLSETGVFGGLWELGEKMQVGMEIEARNIPVHQETIELSEQLEQNPYTMQSAGSLLVVTRDGNGLVHQYEKEGIHAALIGKVMPGHDKVLLNRDERRFIEQPRGMKKSERKKIEDGGINRT